MEPPLKKFLFLNAATAEFLFVNNDTSKIYTVCTYLYSATLLFQAFVKLIKMLLLAETGMQYSMALMFE
jgi:hypothetical protein